VQGGAESYAFRATKATTGISPVLTQFKPG